MKSCTSEIPPKAIDCQQMQTGGTGRERRICGREERWGRSPWLARQVKLGREDAVAAIKSCFDWIY